MVYAGFTVQMSKVVSQMATERKFLKQARSKLIFFWRCAPKTAITKYTDYHSADAN
jgi:hypothetical protein